MVWAKISRWENSLPAWLGATQIQWIPWSYGIWQIFRTNTVILWIVSILPFLWRQRSYRKRVVALNSVRSFWWGLDEDSADYLTRHEMPTTFKIVKRDPFWPEELNWTVVQFQGFFYIITDSALGRMFEWISECDGDETDVIFIETDNERIVGRELSRKQAYEKIFSGQYYVDVISREDELANVPTWIEYTEISSKLWGVLSTLPALLQASGKNKISMLCSFIIIFFDINRTWLNHRIYNPLLMKFVRFVKCHWAKYFSTEKPSCIQLLLFYLFLTPVYSIGLLVFPGRWLATDKVPHVAGMKNEEVNIFAFSKVRSMDEVSIHGHGVYGPGDSVIRIWDGRGMGAYQYMTKGSTYARARLRTPIFVE